MEFQEQLYLLRKKQGLSQEELANIIGVSRQAVQKWESGAARPDLDNLMTLAQYFGVSLDELVGNGQKSSEVPTSKATNGYYTLQPPHAGAVAYYIPCRWHYEYKSKRLLFGFPLVHIHFADRGLAHARGIVAIGNTAMGLFSLGGLSFGLVSLGACSLGLLSVGGAALGGITLGGISVGIAAMGGFALGGMIACGGLAVGNVAVGGCAVGDVALGAQAVGKVAFVLGDHAPITAEIWAGFCKGIQELGFGYRGLSSLLFRLSPK